VMRILQSREVRVSAILLIVLCASHRFRATLTRLHLWLGVWLLLDLIAVNASGYYWGHQLKQLLPIVGIIIGIGLGAWIDCLKHPPHRDRMTVVAIIALVSLCLPYREITRSIDRFHTPPEKPFLELGEWIQDHTAASDKVLGIGLDSYKVLAHSRRLSPVREFTGLFAQRAGMAEEMETALHTNPPRLVVIYGKQTYSKTSARIIRQHYQERSPQPPRRFGYRLLWRKEQYKERL